MALVRSRMSAFALAVLAVLTLVVVQPAVPASGNQFDPPWGILTNRYSYTAVSGITDVETQIPDLEATYGASAFRWVKVTVVLRVHTNVAATTANAYIDVEQITNCSPCGYIRIAGSNTYLPQTGGSGSETMVVTGQYRTDATGGQWRATVSVKRSVGTGTISVSQTSGTPQSIVVEDLGKF